MVEATPSRTWRGQLAVAGIFALGIVFGLAISFVLVHHVGPPDRMARAREAPLPMDRMKHELDLDDAQQEQVRAILERGHATMRGVLDDTSREIREVLRPEQREKFDRMRPRSPFPHGHHGDGPPPGDPSPGEPPPEPPH